MQTAIEEPRIVEELLQGKPYVTLSVIGEDAIKSILSLFRVS